MMVGHDQILVVDIEATCWKHNRAPAGQMSEIIEIGICCYAPATGAISDKQSLIVRPTRSQVSQFCTELTTLTQEQVDAGMAFADACAILVEHYHSRERLWASWGSYDHTMFVRQCDADGLPYPFSDHHLDIRKLWAELHQGTTMGFRRAMEAAQLEMIGTLHRGDDDAWNTARLLGWLHEQHKTDILEPFWTGQTDAG